MVLSLKNCNSMFSFMTSATFLLQIFFCIPTTSSSLHQLHPKIYYCCGAAAPPNSSSSSSPSSISASMVGSGCSSKISAQKCTTCLLPISMAALGPMAYMMPLPSTNEELAAAEDDPL
mmetsp:Transcript_21488/g.31965  ORF Transcript_21488/g.31965 Transcript_21488/m.31965 type:complete len:118 (+) Transcript_21488:284-637(+)